MKREEEIIAEAKKHEYDWGIDVDRFDVPDIFAKGAEWADKTMIEKACRWLKFNTNWDDEWDDMGRNLNYGMIEEFRKAMLEEE